MNRFIGFVGNLSAVGGILICLVSIGFRVAGLYTFLGSEVMSFFIVGVGLMVGGCVAKLHLLNVQRP